MDYLLGAFHTEKLRIKGLQLKLPIFQFNLLGEYECQECKRDKQNLIERIGGLTVKRVKLTLGDKIESDIT